MSTETALVVVVAKLKSELDNYSSALSSLQAKHDRAIKALQDAKERLEWFRDHKGMNSAAQIEWCSQALADEVTDATLNLGADGK